MWSLIQTENKKLFQGETYENDEIRKKQSISRRTACTHFYFKLFDLINRDAWLLLMIIKLLFWLNFTHILL